MTERKYIIYLTTNLDNGMVYKGVHYNKKIDPYEFDGYLGSGVGLLKAIKEFGKENFKRETLFVFDTKKEAIAKEKIEIPIEYVNDPNTYNRTIGGGDWPIMNGENHYQYGKPRTEKTRKLISKNLPDISGENHPMWGKHLTKEHRGKLSKAHKGLQAGKNHPMYGKHPSIETRKKQSENSGKRLPQSIVKQRQLDIKNSSKVFGWVSKLGVKWDVNNSTVGKFIREYSPEFVNPPLFKQRILDVIQIQKVRGWESELGRMWGINNTNVGKFIQKYVSDYVNPPLYEQRLLDIKNEPKTWGYKTRLAKKWGIDPRTVSWFINKYAPECKE